jgi:hypothetical protein
VKFIGLARLAAVAAALVIGGVGLTAPGTASATTVAAPPGYTYHHIHNWHSNLCMGSYSAVVQVGCDFNPQAVTQQWREVPLGGGYILLVSAFTSACLTVANAAQGNNQAVVGAPCTGGATHQQFEKVWAPVGGGFYMLVARHSGKCVTIRSESMQPWAPLVQYECYPYLPVIDPIGAGYWNTI